MNSIHQDVAHSKHSRAVPLFAPGVAKPVAFVNPNLHLLFKTIDGRRHFVRVPPGIAFADCVIRQAGELGAVDIGVTDGLTGDRYATTLDTFLRHCEVVDRGFGRQLVLRFDYWSKNGAPSDVEQLRRQEESRRQTKEVVQLGLFG